MKVFLLHEDTIGGINEYTEFAFLDRETARLVSVALETESTSFKIEEHEAEPISENRCIVAREVFVIDERDSLEIHRENAMAKLNQKEKEAMRSCPCTISKKPCCSGCTCANSISSGGCYCCVSYGSYEQRLEQSRILLEKLRR